MADAPAPAPDAAPILLSDAPADADAFGAHTKIAEAIYRVATGPVEPGTAIAITGASGSGKSTVINLLRKLADRNRSGTDLRVFVFDAWAHDGDPLRRAFLQELVSFLRQAEWADEGFAKACTDRLAARRGSRTSSVKTMLNGWGMALAAAALLVPAGVAMTAVGMRSHPLLWCIGLCFAALPPIVAVAAALAQVRRAEPGPPGDGGAAPRPDKKWRFWARLGRLREVFGNETATEEHSDLLTEPDPTSPEFAAIFLHVLGRAIGEREERRLLIVLDDLDRLDDEPRARLWAVMRTYTDALRDIDGEVASRVLTLVPTLAPHAEPQQGLAVIASPPPEAQPDPAAKMFQATFTVPPPLLTDWRRYLGDKLAEALPAWGDADKGRAVEFFAAVTTWTDPGQVAPRRIKRYVNLIVANELAPVGGCSRVASAALAAALLEEPGWYPTKFSYPGRLGAVGSAMPEFSQIAGLFYRVGPERALQVVFRNRIATALEQGDAEDMKKMFQQSNELGPLVLAVVASSPLAAGYQESARRVGLAAAALAGVSADPEVGEALHRLAAAAMGPGPFLELGAAAGLGLASLCEHSGGLAAHLIGAAARDLGGNAEPNELTVAGYAALLEALASRTDAAAALAALSLPLAPARYLKLIASAPFSARTSALSDLRPSDPSAVVQDLAGRSGNADDLWRQQVSACAAVSAPWDWAPLLGQIKSSLNQNAPAAGLISAALALYRAQPNKVAEALTPARQSGWLFAHGANLTADRDLTRWIAAIMITDPSEAAQNNPPQHLVNAGREKYRNAVQKGAAPGIAAIAEEVLRAGARDAVRANYPKWPEMRTVIAKLAEMDPSWPSAAELVTRENDWRAILGAEGFRGRLAGNRDSAAAAVQSLPFDTARAGIYEKLREPLPAPAGFDDFLRAGLRALDRPQWTAAIEKGGPLLAIAAALGPGLDLPPASALQDALEDAGRKALGGAAVAADPGQIAALCGGLSDSAVAVLHDRLTDALVGAGRTTAPFASLFGDWFVSRAPASDGAIHFVKDLLPRVAGRADEAELSWAARYAARYAKELREVSEPLRQDAVNRLRNSKAAAGGDGIRASIEEIASAIAG